MHNAILTTFGRITEHVANVMQVVKRVIISELINALLATKILTSLDLMALDIVISATHLAKHV